MGVAWHVGTYPLQPNVQTCNAHALPAHTHSKPCPWLWSCCSTSVFDVCASEGS